ncbi:hypothetical protein [Desulfobulbus sp.]|uniref:hypothetical protein n=1 Tax=Desulfobulbus sp. TaxID=895 RepID=UPI0027B8B87E|nr:hypothetical protein [Desulfobulbus sp.]
MHFLMGMFWLGAVLAMISLYVAAAYWVYMAARWCGATWRASRSKETATMDPPFWRADDRKRIRSAIVIAVIAGITAYINQRATWMGEDNAHLQAKEYYVSGQVLNGFRQALTTVIHPDLFVMYPANALQWAICSQGSKKLPENDGEIGVWQNVWFHSHYSKKGRWQLGLNSGESSDKMRWLLDQWWFCLETMATRPFADKQMEEEHYLRDYPALVFSYERCKGFYSYKKIGSAQRLAMMPEHVARARQLSRWLWELPGKWQASLKAREFNAANPKIVALLQTDLLLELISLIQGEIHERKFGCDNESIQRYVAARKEFVEPVDGLPAYRRMKENDQGKSLYEIVIEDPGARSTKYIITHYCGIEVAGKEDNSKWMYVDVGKLHKRTPDEQSNNNARLNYQEEIEILEEQFNER